MPFVDPVQLRSHSQNLFGMDCNVTRLPKVPAAGLMHHDARVGKAVSFLWCTTAQEKGAHGGGLPDTGGGDRTRDVGHGVVDCETGSDRTTGRIDVEVYWLFRGIGFEEEQLGDDGSRHGLVNGSIEADDALLTVYETRDTMKGTGCRCSDVDSP